MLFRSYWVLRRFASVPVGSVRSRLDWASAALAPPMSDRANITRHKIFVIAEPPQAVCFPARGNATHAWAFPRSISSTVGKRVNGEFTGSPGRGSNCGLNSCMPRGGMIRALVAPCGNSLRRRHWAIAGKRTSGDPAGCAPSYADDPKVWSGGARAFQRGSGKSSEA